MKGRGIPCGLSYSVGVYVCNDLLYTLLHHYAGTEVQVGFVHVPFLPEQTGTEPHMALEVIAEALSAAIGALGEEAGR